MTVERKNIGRGFTRIKADQNKSACFCELGRLIDIRSYPRQFASNISSGSLDMTLERKDIGRGFTRIKADQNKSGCSRALPLSRICFYPRRSASKILSVSADV